MKFLKDGTIYLAEVEYLVTNQITMKSERLIRWEIIHWGRMVLIDGSHEGWCGQNEMGLKVGKILRWSKLSDVVELMEIYGVYE